MDGVSHPINFASSDIDVDGNSLAEPWQIYLRIVGSFAIKVGENILYSEQGFCLVEFGIESQLWLKRVTKTQDDFVYTSQESEELGLVWIKREGSVWRVGSVHQISAEPATFQLQEIQRALNRYFTELRNYVLRNFDVDIESLFSWVQHEPRTGGPPHDA